MAFELQITIIDKVNMQMLKTNGNERLTVDSAPAIQPNGVERATIEVYNSAKTLERSCSSINIAPSASLRGTMQASEQASKRVYTINIPH